MLRRKITPPLLIAGASFIAVSTPCFAVDPFEDFREYGELSEEEIHEIH